MSDAEDARARVRRLLLSGDNTLKNRDDPASRERARARLRARDLVPVVARFDEGAPGRVISQTPAPGVAAGPGIRVRLVVGRPSRVSG